MLRLSTSMYLRIKVLRERDAPESSGLGFATRRTSRTLLVHRSGFSSPFSSVRILTRLNQFSSYTEVILFAKLRTYQRIKACYVGPAYCFNAVTPVTPFSEQVARRHGPLHAWFWLVAKWHAYLMRSSVTPLLHTHTHTHNHIESLLKTFPFLFFPFFLGTGTQFLDQGFAADPSGYTLSMRTPEQKIKGTSLKKTTELLGCYDSALNGFLGSEKLAKVRCYRTCVSSYALIPNTPRPSHDGLDCPAIPRSVPLE